MARKPKKATYRYFIRDKEGNRIDIDTLSEEERREVGVWAYQTMLRAMGYVPVDEAKQIRERSTKRYGS